MASMMFRSVAGAAFGTQRPTICPQRLSSARAPVTVATYGDRPNIGGGRKWKSIKVNKNGKRVKVDMHVRRGDYVQIISGHDKGMLGEITSVVTGKGLVVVEGVNFKTKVISPKREGETGQKKKYEFPVHHSNVMLYSKEKGVASRVGYRLNEDGTKTRYLKKTGETVVDKPYVPASAGAGDASA